MRRTWADYPSSERIVEDVTRYPLVIDKIIEHKGGVVPDFQMQHKGCSKRKRKVTQASRLYTPSPEVATIAAERDAKHCARRLRACLPREESMLGWAGGAGRVGEGCRRACKAYIGPKTRHD